MDKKILNLLNNWLENDLISKSTFENIVNFEKNSNPSQISDQIGHQNLQKMA